MKRLVLAIALLLVMGTVVSASEYVSGHFRSNGHYTQGYYRSTPDEPMTIKGEWKND